MNDKYGSIFESPWNVILVDALENRNRVSVLVEGTYKPYTGHVTEVKKGVLTLKNEYSTEYIMITNIKAVRVYD